MAASPLFQFMGRDSGNGRGELHWGRADEDNAPFRGSPLPPMPDEEYENRAVKVYDFNNRTFNVNDPDDNRAYSEVMQMVTNGRAVLVDRQRKEEFFEGRLCVWIYLEWTVPYMQDGKPMLSQEFT
jgi:hypothetical protein